MKTKKRLLGILLSLALILGLVPGMSLTAYAAEEFTSLQQGDVLHPGDAINSNTTYDPGTGIWLNTNQNPWTLVRGDITGPRSITVSDTGAYYFLKSSNGSFYTGAIEVPPDAHFDGGYWPVGANSDGIYVTAVNVGQYATAVTFAVHEGVAVTGVTLNPSTEQTISVDGSVAFTATVNPGEATDKTVKWSVGGTNSDAVKLYKDAACTEEVGTGATETLTVYALGLEVGDATVTVTSSANSNKYATCALAVRDIPHTGGTADFGLWAALLLAGLSGMGIALTAGKRRKARQ